MKSLKTVFIAIALLTFSGIFTRSFAQAYGLDTPQPIGPYLNNVFPPTAPSSSASWNVEIAFTNVMFNQPMFLTPYPGTNRLVMLHKPGRISTLPNRRDVSQTEVVTFLDISARTFTVSDSGLTGLAFHPEFGQAGSTNRGFFYITYKWRPMGVTGFSEYAYWRLSRFTVPDGQTVADPISEVVLVQQFDRQMFHDAGCLMFGADGFLYFSVGDEGGANDQFNSTQTLTERLMSGIFRIDVNRNAATSHPIRRQPFHHPAMPVGWPESFTTNYFVPNDNPFVNADGSVLEEYYALGFRQPYRFSRDPVTGLIWVADSGQSTREEVNILVPGANYQWGFREGTADGPKAPPASIIGFEKTPLWDYGRDQGGAAIGGYVYRGIEHAGFLTGKYIFVDNVSGRIWALTTQDGSTLATVEYLTSMPSGSVYGGTSSCGLDANGEIYFLKFGGDGAQRIFKLTRTTTIIGEPPALLSQVGAFENLATLAPAPGLIPYGVNTPLWSDGAGKDRWMAVPNDGTHNTASEKIKFSATNEWQFPAGTVFVKQFDLPVDENNPTAIKRVETRFLIRDKNNGVYGVTYRWRPDGTDADLLLNGDTGDYTVNTTNGVRTQHWNFPSRLDCLTCHNGSTSGVLGLRTHQLNGDYFYALTGRSDNQLRTLVHLGLFTSEFNESQISTYLKSHNITNTAQPLVTRVRSYIDANCSHCHRPGGQRANFDARFTTPLEQQNLIYGAVLDAVTGPEDRVVRPQDLLHSMLHNRANRVGPLQMPPLAKNEIDTEAIQLFADWINSLPTGPGVTLTRTNAGPVSGPFVVQVEFTEPVTGVASDQFIVANGQVTSLTGSGQNYSVTVTPQAKGTVKVQYSANQVNGSSGQGNYPSNPLSVLFDPLNQFLLTWLPFDDAFGITATDASGNGNSGTLNNAILGAWSSGIIHGALTFDGFDDYVEINNPLGESFTISTWIKTTQLFPQVTPAHLGTGIVWSDVGGFAHDFILGGTRSAEGVNRLSFFVGGSETAINGTQEISTGEWTHLVVTRNGTSGEVKLYVNGTLDVIGTGALSALNANPKIHIGGNTLDGRYFNGAIDDVRFYSRALTIEEIAALLPNTPPIVTLSTSSSFVTNSFIVAASFSEVVSGFNLEDVEIENGHVSEISGSGGAYQLIVQVDAPGQVRIRIPADRALDLDGIGNLASSDLVVTAVGDSVSRLNLISFWPFDETSGATAFDATTSGNHGELMNLNNASRVPGIWGKALSFNGSNSFVRVSNNIGGDFTVSFWIKSTQLFPQTDNVPDGTGLLWSDVPGPNSDFIIAGTRSANGINRLSFFTGNPNSALHGAKEISTGQWTHLAVTRRQSSGARKVFVNGVLDLANTGSTSFLSANPMIHIGGNTQSGHFFLGQMDEVLIYNRVLSDAEVVSLAGAGGYHSWASATMPGISATLTGSLADPDGDGQPNLLEFAFGTDPLAASVSPFTIESASDGFHRIKYPRRTDFTGLRYAVLKSDDLVHWAPAEEIILEAIQSVAGHPIEIVTSRIDESLEHAFYKLEVKSVAP